MGIVGLENFIIWFILNLLYGAFNDAPNWYVATLQGTPNPDLQWRAHVLSVLALFRVIANVYSCNDD